MRRKHKTSFGILLSIAAITGLLIFWLQSGKQNIQEQGVSDLSESSEAVSPIINQVSPVSPVSSLSSSRPEKPTLPADLAPSDKSLGVVSGAIVHPRTHQPISNTDLYLGRLEGMENNFPIIIMRQDSSPHAVSDATGRFVFMDVEPGKYGLIAWSPLFSILVNDPNDPTHTLIIDVEPNKVVYLNVLSVDVP